jgi:hypothetical protein
MTASGKSSPASDAQEIHKLVISAQEQGAPDHYTGKRRWTRFTAGMHLEITTDPTNPSATIYVTMQNVSEGGLSFWCKREFEQRTPIFVRESGEEEGSEWLAARVRHCTHGIRGYLVGAEFENPTSDDANLAPA